MRIPHDFYTRAVLGVSLSIGWFTASDTCSFAGEVLLKNGTVIQGKPVPLQSLKLSAKRGANEIVNYPILLVQTELQRYFLPARQVSEINRDADLAYFQTFQLQQRKTARKLMLRSVGTYIERTPFDEFGRRRIKVAGPKNPIHIFQGVTEIHPKYLTVIGLNYVWRHGLAPTSIAPNTLDVMIRKATDQTKPDDRLAIARFYLQAGLYQQSLQELDSIVKDFPDLSERAEEFALRSRQLLAKRLFSELRHRRAAGQHRLAYVAAKQFPLEKISVTVLRDVRRFIAEYDESQVRGKTVLAMLGKLQEALTDSKQMAAVAPLRAEINEQLNVESLNRLDAFLKFHDDESLSPAEKLAVAYSGWVVGSANAITNLDAARRLWKARSLIMDYLQETDTTNLRRHLARLQNVEGVSVRTIAHMIPRLPPLIETPGIQNNIGRVMPIQVAQPDNRLPVAYSVLLPLEYDLHHSYPMIVALRDAGHTAEYELTWWGGTQSQPGQSQRHGYIVIAPEYATENQRDYDYSAAAHYVILQSIRDARKRFNVNSDRLYLAGHGMGGDAAFDLGMSHPDVFAGVIPITGVSAKYCKHYWPNAKGLAWYVIGGELDRNTFERNARDLNQMLRRGYDLIYTEFIGRGHERYYGEVHKLFDWMQLHTRTKYPDEVEARILRPVDNRFFWLKFDGLPRNATLSIADDDLHLPVNPVKLTARVTVGNTIHVRSGAKSNTIWLSPKFVDFDRRVKIQINGQRKFNDFLRPDFAAMLADLRSRGDRQKLYSVKLTFD